MIKILGIMVLMGLAISCGDGFDENKNHGHRGGQNSQETDAYTVNIKYLELVNEYRINKKLRPLEHHSIIEEVSFSHSKSMGLQTRPFGHAGLNLRCRRLKNRLGRHKNCSELVAIGAKNFNSVFEYWVDLPKYRDLLDQPDITHTGLGIYKDSGGVIYWTQMFIELK
jgi:uncharacterized protein YkwD